MRPRDGRGKTEAVMFGQLRLILGRAGGRRGIRVTFNPDTQTVCLSGSFRVTFNADDQKLEIS